MDYGADHDDGIEVVDEFPEAVNIPEDAMDVDKVETKDDDEALDDVMVIEGPETVHPDVENMPEESKEPETAEAAAGGTLCLMMLLIQRMT